MKPKDSEACAKLAKNFELLGIPGYAASWLIDLYLAFQLIDDVRDGDPVDGHELARVVLVSLPGNQWAQANAGLLWPVLSTQVFKWFGANDLEATGDRSNAGKAYMWRAGYFDVVLFVMSITIGPEQTECSAKLVADLYGETIDEFLKEQGHA